MSCFSAAKRIVINVGSSTLTHSTGMLHIRRVEHLVKVLADIAIAKCCLMKGGEPNIDKAASMLIDDFRSLRLGKVTLEQPPQSEEE